MIDAELNELCVLLDQLWGGMDEGREAAFRWLLADQDGGAVRTAVRQLAQEDRPWLPKPPEIMARVIQVERQRATDRHLQECRARLAGALERDAALAQLVERVHAQRATER